jgi:hypothetical protein
MFKYTYCILLIVLSTYSFGQKSDNRIFKDVNGDNIKEEFLFYGPDGEIAQSGAFSKFCLISMGDTICYCSSQLLNVEPKRFKIADDQIDGKLGVFYEGKRVFFWLSCFEELYSKPTRILEWKKDSLVEVYFDDLEVQKYIEIDNKKYLGMEYPNAEVYGNLEGEYHFSTYSPVYYMLLGEGMKIDSVLTQKRNTTFERIEDFVDVFHACIVHENKGTNSYVISNSLERSLLEREYGILSIVELPKNYFKKFDLKELRIMRNEIFAYFGYSFKSDDLKKHFQTMHWYKPTDITSEEIYGKLSDIEKHNLLTIQVIEKYGF